MNTTLGRDVLGEGLWMYCVQQGHAVCIQSYCDWLFVGTVEPCKEGVPEWFIPLEIGYVVKLVQG